MTRILIVDDHAVVRQGLRTFLILEPDFEVVGEAEDGAQAVKRSRQLRPDVVMMDLVMPEMDGIAATRLIREELPDTQVIVLTSVLEDASVADAVRAGAIGYVLKDAKEEELTRAIRAAAIGQAQLSPHAAARLMREVRAPDTHDALSAREVEVLGLLARGGANKDIARELVITEKTVKKHVSAILSKLGVESRTQAALLAGRIGLVPTHQLGAGTSPSECQTMLAPPRPGAAPGRRPARLPQAPRSYLLERPRAH